MASNFFSNIAHVGAHVGAQVGAQVGQVATNMGHELRVGSRTVQVKGRLAEGKHENFFVACKPCSVF
jgi:hypothetical protein